tara:strand:- start:56 stop:292 length:237 start_codon:yes stop_codon:yes gene_type:complete
MSVKIVHLENLKKNELERFVKIVPLISLPTQWEPLNVHHVRSEKNAVVRGVNSEQVVIVKTVRRVMFRLVDYNVPRVH